MQSIKKLEWKPVPDREVIERRNDVVVAKIGRDRDIERIVDAIDLLIEIIEDDLEVPEDVGATTLPIGKDRIVTVDVVEITLRIVKIEKDQKVVADVIILLKEMIEDGQDDAVATENLKVGMNIDRRLGIKLKVDDREAEVDVIVTQAIEI